MISNHKWYFIKVSQGDSINRRMLLFTLILAALVSAAKATTSSSSSGGTGPIFSDDSLFEQQLGNEKMQLLQSQDNFNSIQDSGSILAQNRHNQVIANDLLEQPEAEVFADAHRRRQQVNNQQQQQQQKPQHQRNKQKVLSQAVINGNHATYAEPPADFKPIIYDFDDRQRQQQAQAAAAESNNAAESSSNPDGSSMSLNQLMPSGGAGSSSSGESNQQHQQQQVPSRPYQAPLQDPLLISYSPADYATLDRQRPAASVSHVEHQAAQYQPLASEEQQQQQVSSSNQPALKPSVGRWSDWHDMSIEPDLASSDTQSSQVYYSPQPMPPNYYAGPSAAAASPPSHPQLQLYKTRYSAVLPTLAVPSSQPGVMNGAQSVPSSWFASQNPQVGSGGQQADGLDGLSLTMVQPPQHQLQQQQNKQAINSEQVNFMPMTATANGVQFQQPLRRFVVSSTSSNGISSGNQVKRPLPPPAAADLQTQIITGSQSSSSLTAINSATSQAAPSQISAAAAASAIKGSPKVALNLISHNNLLELKQQREENHEHDSLTSNSNHPQNQDFVAWKQQHQVMNQQPALKQQSSDWEQQVPMPTKMAQQQPKTASNQRRLRKRRRKSKSNAEVRILQLVAASQQQQQQQQELAAAANSKQVNGLPAHNQHTHQQNNQHKQQQHYHSQQQHQLQHQHQQVDQPQLQQEQQLGERVQPASQQVKLAQKPNHSLVVKKLGPTTSQVQHQQQSSNPIRRQVKSQKRRIKTLLPVGLSSWFLGGIRALDGRHWQLPSEVISRLAVNDVDFVGSQPARVAPPAAGSVVLIGAQQPPVNSSGAEQTTSSSITDNSGSNSSSSSSTPASNSSHTSRLPISQIVPR